MPTERGSRIRMARAMVSALTVAYLLAGTTATNAASKNTTISPVSIGLSSQNGDFVYDINSADATINIPANETWLIEYFSIEVRCGDGCTIDNLEIITMDKSGNQYLHFPAPPEFNEFQTIDGKIAFATQLTLYSDDELKIIIQVSDPADQLIRGSITGQILK